MRGVLKTPSLHPMNPAWGGGAPTRLYGAAMRRSRTRWGTATAEQSPVWHRPCVVRTLCGQGPVWSCSLPEVWGGDLTGRPMMCRTAGAVREVATLCEEESRKRAAREARFAAAPEDQAAGARTAAKRHAWPGGTMGQRPRAVVTQGSVQMTEIDGRAVCR